MGKEGADNDDRRAIGRLRAVIDNAVDGMVVIDANGTALLFNPAAELIFGYSADEVLGHDIKMLMPPPFGGKHDGYIKNYLRTGEQRIVGIGREVVGCRKDGTTFPMHLSVGETKEDGAPIFIGVIRDLTAVRNFQETLRQTEFLLSGIVESSDDAIISKTLDGIVTTWNKAAEQVFGYSADEAIGRHISIIAVPGHEDDLTNILERIRSGQRVEHYETQRRRKDGSILDISLTVSPLMDGQGRIIGASKIARDITQKKASEDALRRSEEHLARVQGVAHIGSTEIDLQTGRITWSDEAYLLLGLDKDTSAPDVELFATTVHPDDREFVRKVGIEERNGHEQDPIEFRVLAPDGSLRWIHQKTAFSRNAEGVATRLISTMYDITDRKRAEIELRTSEERYRLTFDLAPVGIAHLALDGRFLLVNQTLCKMFGMTQAELLAKDFRSMTHPDDAEESDRHMARMVSGEASVLSWEKRYLLKDGSVIWCHLTSTFSPGGGRYASHFVTAYEDITERKSAEDRRRRLEEQLRQSQKMEAVGQLTGGVAHDFNNLLTVVLGNLELVRERVEDDAKVVRQIDSALSAGRRGADLTHRLLAFSRRQALEPVVVDINRTIAELVPLLSRTLGENIEISQKLGAPLWKVLVDPGQFENAVMNLAVNARDAMSHGGRLKIETENVAVDEIYAAQRPELATGNYVRISVSDTGTGMPPHVVERAFEPFFTTKEVGKGTGLGLSMIYGFVKQSGGHAAIYSEVGIGTTITMLLPADLEVKASAEERKAATPVKAGSETILVVEDDGDVRTLAISFLEGLGYRTLEAATARDGFKVFIANPDIGLIVTDVVLPGGEEGASFAHRAAGLRSWVKVLFMSGYTDEVLMHDGRLDAGVVLLRKPFTRTQLAEKVRAAIEGPALTPRTSAPRQQ